MIKKVLYVLLSAILISSVIYIINESEKISILDSIIPEKLAVYKNVRMSGVEASGEAWEIYAKEGWTGRDKFMTTLEHVTDGKMSKDGRVMIKDLKSRRVRMTKNKNIEIFKQVEGDPSDGYLIVAIDFGSFSKTPKRTKNFSIMTADLIKFNPDSRLCEITGNIRIIKDKLDARTEKIRLDLNANVATFESRSTFVKESSRLSSNTAIAFFDKDIISMTGSIEVNQKNKKIYSDFALYNDTKRNIILRSRVKAVINKLKNVIKKESTDKYKGEDSQKALTTKTILTCNELTVFTENNDAVASGNVHVYQNDKEARSDGAKYSEKDEIIVMKGNVQMKKKEGWVKADKVLVSVNKESLEAIGRVETIFNVKKGSRR